MLVTLLVLVVTGSVAFLLGPRAPSDYRIGFDAASLPDDLDQHLADSEAGFADLKTGSEKQIVWAYPASKAKTPVSIVYVHGFSASAGEIRPLPDRVAADLGANLFFTRLAGHGRSGDAMLDGSVDAWMNDYAEAIAIGARLGENVIVMATSTGATLATLAAAEAKLDANVAGYVFFSPNFGVRNPAAKVLTLPWAEKLVPLIAGKRRSFETRSDLHRQLWTSDYPTLALLPMGALVKRTAAVDPARITAPALFVLSPKDEIVDPALSAAVAARWAGAGAKVLRVETSGDPQNHVIAGDAMSPQTTRPLAADVTAFINSLELP